MKHGNQALSAATAATLSFGPGTNAGILPGIHNPIISSTGSAVVFAKVNWKSGDTEVSATNFDFIIPIGGSVNLQGLMASLDNLRLLSSAIAVLGYIGS